jgi:N-acetylneuraminic acid mutarotase
MKTDFHPITEARSAAFTLFPRLSQLRRLIRFIPLCLPALGLLGTQGRATTPLPHAPCARHSESSVWTGTEMIVWGGHTPSGLTATGGRYHPATATWRPPGTLNTIGGLVAARHEHTAIWTGTEMIVWGGTGTSGVLSAGGRYDPATDTWLVIPEELFTSTPVQGRRLHTAVWTGTEMIIWGGWSGTASLNDGARYNPLTQTWAPVSTVGAPSARHWHRAVWTGTEMIVWGGYDANVLGDGARYNPTSNTWTPLPSIGAPSARSGHAMVWTGTELMVWGGNGIGYVLSTGARWVPGATSWTAMSSLILDKQEFVPGATICAAAWDGEGLVVAGGYGSLGSIPRSSNVVARYLPAVDRWWVKTNLLPFGSTGSRVFHSSVWTGTGLIIHGGIYASYDLVEDGFDQFGRVKWIDVPVTRTLDTGWFIDAKSAAAYPLGVLVRDFRITQMARMDSSRASITWDGVPGFTYQVWRSDSLTTPSWTKLGAPTTSSTIIDPAATVPQRFYRVERLEAQN